MVIILHVQMSVVLEMEIIQHCDGIPNNQLVLENVEFVMVIILHVQMNVE